MLKKILVLSLLITPLHADEMNDIRNQLASLLDRLADVESRMTAIEGQANEGTLPAKESGRPSEDKTNVDLRNIVQKLNDLEARVNGGAKSEGFSPVAKKVEGLDIGSQASQESSSSEADEIIADLEGLGGRTPEETKAMKNAIEKSPVLPVNDFEAQYDAAMGLMKKEKYKEAVEALNYCLKKAPEKEGDRVTFQLGRAHEGCHDLDRAKKAYVTAYKKNPKGPMAAKALFRLAAVFKEQKNTKNACVTLKEISKRFSSVEPGLKKKIEAMRKEAKCGV